MLRRICLLLIVALFFVPTSILAGEQSSEKLAEGFLHENIYTENNELKAERSTEVNVDIKNLKITEDDIKIIGEIDNNKNFIISGNINDGSIDGVEEKSNKFEVLSINVLDDFILMYLSENSNAYKIKIYHNNTGEDLFYNRYWYLDFIKPEIEKVEVFTPFAYNTNYIRKYERTYHIWSDYYTEELNLFINFNWPEVTRATSAGDLFTSKIQIMSQFTHVNEYNGRKYTLSGTSLSVAGATVRHGTDQGQYVKDVNTRFVGTKYNGGYTSIGYSLGIPKTPLSINYTPPYRVNITQESNGYYSFNYYGDNVSQQHNITWDPYRYHLVKNNDYFEVQSRIQTDRRYAKIGSRNRLSIEWQYEIVSSGINHGHAAPPYNRTDRFSNTLYYDLVN